MKLSKTAFAASMMLAASSAAFAESPIHPDDDYTRFNLSACTSDGMTAHAVIEMPPLSRAKNRKMALAKIEKVKQEVSSAFKEGVGKSTASDLQDLRSEFNQSFPSTITSISVANKVMVSGSYAYEMLTHGCTVK